MQKKKLEKDFPFCDIWIWIGCIKLTLWSGKNLSSAVNVLTKNLKNLIINNKNYF